MKIIDIKEIEFTGNIDKIKDLNERCKKILKKHREFHKLESLFEKLYKSLNFYELLRFDDILIKLYKKIKIDSKIRVKTDLGILNNNSIIEFANLLIENKIIIEIAK